MTAIENTFTLDVPSTTENLALIREFVSRVAAQAGLNETEVGQLELAVDEACANVIERMTGAPFDPGEATSNVSGVISSVNRPPSIAASAR